MKIAVQMNFSFIDAPYNLKYYKEGNPDTEIAYMGCVRGDSIITYTTGTEPIEITFKELWDSLSETHDVHRCGISTYIDLENSYFRIHDTSSDGFVKCKKLIRNPNRDNWYCIRLADGTILECTADHPLPKFKKGKVTECNGNLYVQLNKPFSDMFERTYVMSLKHGDLIPVTDMFTKNGFLKLEAIISIERIDIDECSYDVETASDRFDVNGIISHNCRTRVISNIYDSSREIVTGRGNLSFTSINLPRLAIRADGDLNKFYTSLEHMMDICKDQLLERFKLQCNKTIKNYPMLMGQGVWIDSDKLSMTDTLESVLKHGTLSIGFIGLAETLVVLTGKHHGESKSSQVLGLQIIKFMRDYTDRMSEQYKLNFSLLATPAEGLCLAGDTLVQTPYGNVPIKDIKEGDLVFSYNLDTNEVEIDTVAKSQMTSPSRKVMKITFDTGQEVICTPNHPFAVKHYHKNADGKMRSVNGTNEYIKFVNAENLKVGDRIKSNYIEVSQSGYKRFKNTHAYVHKMVYEYYNGSLPDGYIVHHIDENKLNNHPNNLQSMKASEHKIYHMKDTIRAYCYSSESQMGKNNTFYGKHHSDKSKQLISESKKLNSYINNLIEDYYNGLSVNDLADKYMVTVEAICRKLKSLNVSLESNHVIVAIEYLEEEIPVYDLTMTNNSNFFVGGDRGILVHNSGRFIKMDRQKFGEIKGVTDKEYYTNSFHKICGIVQ